MRVLLFGYYGHRNFGDDLLMKLAVDQLSSSPGISSLALTSIPSGVDYVRKLCPEVDKVESTGSGLSCFRRYDRVIFGGGGTVFEYRPDLGLVYAIRKRIADLRYYGLAKLSGTRFASIGLGIGPFVDDRAELIAINRLGYHDLVFLRDRTSFDLAHKQGNGNVYLSHDLSLLDAKKLAGLRVNRSQQDGSVIMIVIRNFKYGSSRNKYIDPLIGAARQFEKQNKTIKWISFQEDYDRPVIDKAEEAGYEVWKWRPDSMQLSEVYEMIAEAGLVITARMHGTYIAGMLGIPTVNIGLHPKLRLASEYFNNSICISSDPTELEVADAVSRISEDQANHPVPAMENIQSDLDEMFRILGRWIRGT